MKLKNKKTGEIKEFVLFDGENELQGGATLKELVEDWEDVLEEEPYWSIDCFSPDGLVSEFTGSSQDVLINRKSIGNYFESKEEALATVEKLKAWKRLKDKGYYFSNWSLSKLHFEIELRVKEYDFVTDELKQDLDLLFGGEDE